jgi:hypothetical protein
MSKYYELISKISELLDSQPPFDNIEIRLNRADKKGRNDPTIVFFNLNGEVKNPAGK